MKLNTFLYSGFHPIIRSAARAVVAAGDAVKMLEPDFQVKEGEGHRSGVTKGDELSQQIMLERLVHKYPSAKFLSEEKGAHPNLLDTKNPIRLFETPLAFVLDPLDGTAPYGSKLGTWCIAAGVMRYGKLIGSALYAPALNSGLLVVSEAGRRVRIAEWGFEKTAYIQPFVESRKPKDCFVAMGVDPTLYPSVMNVVPEIGANIRAWNLANSGLLGLAFVACGRLQAIVQTPQKAWDWAPAYRAVIASGGVFRFFRLVPDKSMPDETNRTIPETDMLVPIISPDFNAFCAMPKSNRLGFVAGEPGIAGRIFARLPRCGWARTNPDTASGTWA